MTNFTDEQLKNRAEALKLYGLLANWNKVSGHDWLETLLLWEEAERQHRSLERRLRSARIGRFKSLADFDWAWPDQCDHGAIEELMQLTFVKESSNAILIGPNGVGKTTIARNIAYEAVIKGYTVLFTTAGHMLNELASQDGDNALRRKLKYYSGPSLLVIDEIGYLSYSNRHADLLFEVISRRYEKNSTLVTTNRPFGEWNEVFPNAACVVSMVDRLIHDAEILQIQGQSFRARESAERTQQRQTQRNTNPDKQIPSLSRPVS